VIWDWERGGEKGVGVKEGWRKEVVRRWDDTCREWRWIARGLEVDGGKWTLY